MSKYFPRRALRATLMSLLVLVFCASYSLPQARHNGKIFGGYFEEWESAMPITTLRSREKWRCRSTDAPHLRLWQCDSHCIAGMCCCRSSGGVSRSNPPKRERQTLHRASLRKLGAIQQLKALHPNLTVLISLGGQAGNVAGFTNAQPPRLAAPRSPPRASTCSSRATSLQASLRQAYSTASISIGSSRQRRTSRTSPRC